MSFHKQGNLKSHLLKHTKDKPLSCPVENCSSRFKRDKALKHHVATQHSETKPKFLCVYCGMSFESLSGKA